MQFPDERLAMHQANLLFKKELEEVDRIIQDTWGEKGEDYDVETPIWHRMPFGDASFAHELFKKADRGVALVKKGVEPTNESLDQNIVDIIVYGRAWLAVRRTLATLQCTSQPLTPFEGGSKVTEEPAARKLTRPTK